MFLACPDPIPDPHKFADPDLSTPKIVILLVNIPTTTTTKSSSKMSFILGGGGWMGANYDIQLEEEEMLTAGSQIADKQQQQKTQKHNLYLIIIRL